jgi:hypothetical protein
MTKLIHAVINGVILNEQIVTRNGKYRVTTILKVSHGMRNNPDGYWERVYESGGFENNDSFYGKDGEPFDSPEEAAEWIISRRNILGVDAHDRVIRKK